MPTISAIEVFAEGHSAGKLFHLPDTREHVFRYESDHPVSLVMAPSPKDYISKFHLHPIFDMNLPEGWLFETLRNLLRKRRYCEENDGFSEFGRRMIDIFRTSLADSGRKRIKGRTK